MPKASSRKYVFSPEGAQSFYNGMVVVQFVNGHSGYYRGGYHPYYVLLAGGCEILTCTEEANLAVFWELVQEFVDYATWFNNDPWWLSEIRADYADAKDTKRRHPVAAAHRKALAKRLDNSKLDDLLLSVSNAWSRQLIDVQVDASGGPAVQGPLLFQASDIPDWLDYKAPGLDANVFNLTADVVVVWQNTGESRLELWIDKVCAAVARQREDLHEFWLLSKAAASWAKRSDQAYHDAFKEMLVGSRLAQGHRRDRAHRLDYFRKKRLRRRGLAQDDVRAAAEPLGFELVDGDWVLGAYKITRWPAGMPKDLALTRNNVKVIGIELPDHIDAFRTVTRLLFDFEADLPPGDPESWFPRQGFCRHPTTRYCIEYHEKLTHAAARTGIGAKTISKALLIVASQVAASDRGRPVVTLARNLSSWLASDQESLQALLSYSVETQGLESHAGIKSKDGRVSVLDLLESLGVLPAWEHDRLVGFHD